MRAVIRFLLSRWVLGFVGALALALVVWFVGPLVAVADVRPFEADWVRLLIVLAIAFGWGLWVILGLMARRRREKALEEGIAEPRPGEQVPSAAERATAEEVAILSDRLDEAVGTLRKSGGGRGRGRGQYLYELPWYVLIGPPGSGKTTALLNSGLRFPLGDDREAAVRGVAGTRNCDWWFADEAILLDTAGRYTTQDSDGAADAGAWKGFLGLLRKTRPKQPINGAFVCLSVEDLLTGDEAERRRHAAAIRARLSELQGELGVRFPVYVLFTKADLIGGFVEFFDDLGREERAQVWGATFPFDDGRDPEGAVAGFAREFDLLVERLSDRALERVHQELDRDRRATIFGFPTQVAALKAPLQRFLEEVFRPSRLERRFLLRGVYFTSGTQEGRPIDRVMAAMGRAFGLSGAAKAAGSGGRAYFLQDLMRRVAFSEAGLVNTSPVAERREKRIRAAALAASVLVLAGAGTAWGVSYYQNQAMIAEAEADLAAYREEAAKLGPETVNRPEPARVVPALDILRDMPAGYASEGWPPLSQTFGLYQGRRIGAQSEAAYRRALEELLLPTLVARMAQMISANLDEPGFLYEALKVYLTLGGRSQGTPDADMVAGWMRLDWETQLYPGPQLQDMRARLGGHLDALLDIGTLDYTLDDSLIGAARAVIARERPAERAYQVLLSRPEATDLPDWLLTEQVGRAAATVFERRSGLPLDTPIDGIFTKRGFYTVYLPAVPEVVQEMKREGWVMGEGASGTFDPRQTALLQRRLLELYYADYIEAWRDGLLQDLQFQRQGSAIAMANLVNDLASPASPATILLQQVGKETTLTEPPIDTAAGAGTKATEVLDNLRSGVAPRWMRELENQIAENVAAPGQPVEDAFRDLHQFLAGSGFDTYQQQLTRLFRRLEEAAARGETLRPELAELPAGGLPAPLDGWTRGLSGNVAEQSITGSRSAFKGAWNGQVADECRQVVSGRYPFSRGAQAEVPLPDFARIFGPGGLLERFWQETLSSMVDTSGKPWRWREGSADRLGLPADMPEQFRRAEAIRTAFFGGGGTTPRVTFSLEPVALDPSAEQVTLSVDGAEISYAHGPPRAQDLQWPGQSGVRQARVAFRPPDASGQSAITLNGPWAWFRLIDRAETRREGADRMSVVFRIGQRRAVWALRAHSVENPFALAELRTFACPPRL